MPFRSKQQVKFLFSQKPALAKKWRKENPNQNIKKLPTYAKKKK